MTSNITHLRDCEIATAITTLKKIEKLPPELIPWIMQYARSVHYTSCGICKKKVKVDIPCRCVYKSAACVDCELRCTQANQRRRLPLHTNWFHIYNF